jgi:hypothetical protein
MAGRSDGGTEKVSNPMGEWWGEDAGNANPSDPSET